MNRIERFVAVPLVILAALVVAACDGRSRGEAEADAVEAAVPGDWWEGTTADGTWAVRWRPLVAPIPTLDPFAVEVQVLGPDGEPVSDGLDVMVDASMPHHGHGMNVVPRVTATDDGWIAEGMLLHMPGRWEFVVDVEQGHGMERAQWTLTLDD